MLLSPHYEWSCMSGQVIVISGAPGVGKTEVIKRLSVMYEKTVHVSVDKIRSFVKLGYKSPDNWNPETEKQYKIALKAAAYLSKMHSENNYLVFVDDVFWNEWKREFEEIADNKEIIYIYLRENIYNIQKRNSDRSHVVDSEVVRDMYYILEKGNTARNGWTRIKNESINSTVKKIKKVINGVLE